MNSINSIIGILSTTNIIGLLYYYNVCSANKYYKEELNTKNKIIDHLQIQYTTSQENLEKLATKMRNNNISDIDFNKYIDYKCPKCYNNNKLPNMYDYIWGTYSCCETCFRCRKCGDKKF
jgi:hypothetical protein